MKNLSKMWLEIWTDGRYDMLSLRAERPEGSSGMQYVWFVLSRVELEGLTSGRISVAEDGYHKLTVSGDSWFFYDMDCFPTAVSGEMKVRFLNAEIPRTFMKAVFRLCRKTWALQRAAEKNGASKYDLPRVRVDISQKVRERACRLFGQGKGMVNFDFGYKPEESRAFWEKCVLEGGESFTRSTMSILNIARNSTWGTHQQATLRISKDLDGFCWAALAPNGKVFFNGGIVNHSRDGGHDWSVHT